MKAKHVLKCTTAAVALALSAMAGQANAWTFTTIGTIGNGTDYQGVFGASGSDLSGLSYKDVITLDPALYQTQVSDSYSHNGYGSLTGTATDTLTINGVTQVFTWDLFQNNYGQSYLRNLVTQGDLGNYDQAYQNQYGSNVNGVFDYNYSYVFTYSNSMHLGLGYNQNWSYHVQPSDQGYTYIYHLDNKGNDEFSISGTPSYIAI